MLRPLGTNVHNPWFQIFLHSVTERFACSAYYIVHIIAGILLMIANASSRVDRCRNDPVGIIVIHTGTHHTGAVIHAWKRHGCNLTEIYAHVLLHKLRFIDIPINGNLSIHGIA